MCVLMPMIGWDQGEWTPGTLLTKPVIALHLLSCRMLLLQTLRWYFRPLLSEPNTQRALKIVKARESATEVTESSAVISDRFAEIAIGLMICRESAINSGNCSDL